ncbi:MAG: 6-hydroxymethylpterin diphosphokinase MptE-like protein [Vicinamibacterales bacterium]
MTTVLADNLAALERRYGIPVALPSVSSATSVSSVSSAPSAASAPSAPSAARVRLDGPAVELQTADGRWLRLVSARDPLAEAELWVGETLGDTKPDVLVLVGGGLGYVLDALDAQDRSPRVVVVEPEPLLAEALLARRDWRAWIDAGRLAVLVGPAYTGASAIVRQVPGLERADLHVHPAFGRAWPDEAKLGLAAGEKLKFEAASNQQARKALAGRYLRHTLANAARLAREGDAAALVDLLPGTPAVIAAAGPSLDRNFHDLHRIKDRAVVIACDTAARPLLNVGIEPQLVVAIDPSVANACHLGALHEPGRTWLAAEASVHPTGFAQFEGRTFLFRIGDHAPWPWLREAGFDRLQVSVWGSVITAAFDLALRMGCDPIIFSGADLAFTGGRPYCRGTTLEAQWASWVEGGSSYERAFAMLMDRWTPVTELDLFNTPTRTASHLVAFRDWMRERAKRAPAVRVINATGAGILRGATFRQSSGIAALAQHPPLDLDAVQARLAAAHGRPAATATLFDRIDALAQSGWSLPGDWRLDDAAAAPEALRRALESPEYAAWRLGRSGSALHSQTTE